jgi:hypothetical protein
VQEVVRLDEAGLGAGVTRDVEDCARGGSDPVVVLSTQITHPETALMMLYSSNVATPSVQVRDVHSVKPEAELRPTLSEGSAAVRQHHVVGVEAHHSTTEHQVPRLVVGLQVHRPDRVDALA